MIDQALERDASAHSILGKAVQVNQRALRQGGVSEGRQKVGQEPIDRGTTGEEPGDVLQAAVGPVGVGDPRPVEERLSSIGQTADRRE